MTRMKLLLLVILLSCIAFAECKKKTRKGKTKKASSSVEQKGTLSCPGRSNSSVCQLVVNFCPRGRTVIQPFSLRGRKGSGNDVKKISEELNTDYEDYGADYDDPYDLYYMSQEVVDDIMRNIDVRIERKIDEKLAFQAPSRLEQEEVVIFSFSPDTVVPGITEQLQLNCSIPVSLGTERRQVLSITIDKQTGSKTDKVALLTEGLKPLSLDTSISDVSGRLSKSGRSLSYLVVSWSYPSQDIGGHYVCSVGILNSSRDVEQVEREMTVPVVRNEQLEELNSSVTELQDSLYRLHASHIKDFSSLQESVQSLTTSGVSVQEAVDRCTAEVKEVLNIVASQSSRIEELEKQLTSLERTQTSLSAEGLSNLQTSSLKHVETGTVVCPFESTVFRDSDYYKNITLPVWFNVPYSRPPLVFLSLTLIDANKNSNLRVTVQQDQVAVTGFTLVCSTWHDTKAYNIVVSWLSIAQ